MSNPVTKAAEISPCAKYRYWLSRTWGAGDRLTFVMLNPSSADAEYDDPTIRRCMGFARREGADGIYVVNLFALRATDPTALLNSDISPYGPQNRSALSFALETARRFPVVCAWGAHALAVNPARVLVELSKVHERQIVCLGKTKQGHPRHPLYVPNVQRLEPYP